MNLHTIIVIFFLIFEIAFASKCNKQRDDEMDVCGQRLLVLGYNQTRRFPITEQEMNLHCSELKSAHRCVKRYSTDCLDTADKPLLDLVHEGSANEIKKICTDKEGRKEFIKHAKCYNRHILQLHRCMQTYVENTQLILKAERAEKIPLTCCEHIKFKKCVERLMNVGCDAKDKQYMMKMVDGLAISVFELMCGQITENEEVCNNLPERTASDKRVTRKSLLSNFHIIYQSLLENPAK